MPALERKLATMLFADLVGSTALASFEDPEHVRAVLDRFYDAMTDEIEATGGTIEKFAGDAVLAVFGVPVAHEDHAERALHAALAMRDRLRELFDGRLALRIGVNTGEVVVGEARAGSSFVSGDPVNVAARLEQGAAPGEILVGERTAAAVGAAFAFAEPVTISAKGKDGGVVARRLEVALAANRPRGGPRDVFVGRTSELDVLLAVCERVAVTHAPEVALVVGEPGIGKTRLLRALEDRLRAERPDWRVLTGRCRSYGRGLTYRPLGDMLRQALGMLESDTRESVLERLCDRPLLGLALGLDVTQLEVAPSLHPVVVRERFRDAWTALLDEWLGEGPVVLLVEDVHWAEEPLLELLGELISRVRGALVVLATARPEAARRLAPSTHLDLSPLSPETATALANALLEGDLPPEVGELVVGRSGGNPFLVEEVLATLVDRRVLVRGGGGWLVRGDLRELALPDTVQALIASRIDLLPASEKHALQTASVVGRVFWEAPVRELAGGSEHVLELLVERQFVVRQPVSSLAGEIEYVFKHQLTREVAYASLTKAERGRTHAAVAERLERGGDERVAALLAHHYEQAVTDDYAVLAWPGDPTVVTRLSAKALHWLGVAAEQATSRYDMAAAVALYERAVELAPDDAARHALWQALASAQSLRYDTRGFVSATHRAIELAPDEETVARLYAELALRSCTAWLAWNPPLERAEVDGWIERALQRSAPASRERAMALIARAWHAEKDVETASEALAIAEDLDDPELVCWALRASVIATTQVGRYPEAWARARRVIPLLDAVPDPGARETILENTVLRVAAQTGRFDEARGYGDLVVELVRDLTPHNRLHGVAYTLEIEELAGGWEHVRSLEPGVEQAVEENRETPCVRNARALLVCALAEAALGDDGRARRYVDRASTLGIAGFNRELTAPLLRIALLRGDTAEVERLLEGYGRPTLRYMFDMAGATAWLDAVATIGRRGAVEDVAPELAVPGTCMEPFALRALGLARRDATLLARADQRFGDLGLDWYAANGPR